MSVQTPSSDASAGLAAPLAHQAVVVLQGGLYCVGSSCFMKEVWYEYLSERFFGLFEKTILAAPVSRSAGERSQEALIDTDGVEVVDLQRRFRGALVLLRAIRKADLVWLFLPTVRGLAAGVACGLLRVPYVVYLGADVTLCGRRLPSRVRDGAYRRVLRKAGAAIAAGGELVESARRHQPAVEPAIPAIGVGARHLRETAERGPRPRAAVCRWLYVGNLHRRKRPDVVLRAFARWSETSGRTGELHLVGGDPGEVLNGLAEELGIAADVHWHGYVRNGDALFDIYRQSDVFVLASEQEGFPRVLYEAMAFGVPIVTTPVSGVPYLLGDGVDCLMVPMGDPEGMATAVQRLDTDRALRDGLVANALKVVRPIVTADGPAQVRRAVLRATGVRFS